MKILLKVRAAVSNRDGGEAEIRFIGGKGQIVDAFVQLVLEHSEVTLNPRNGVIELHEITVPYGLHLQFETPLGDKGRATVTGEISLGELAAGGAVAEQSLQCAEACETAAKDLVSAMGRLEEYDYVIIDGVSRLVQELAKDAVDRND